MASLLLKGDSYYQTVAMHLRHFERRPAGPQWEVVKGFHVLRHSFNSARASKGVGQRLIDEWTGHSTEERRRRYRHLYPTTQQAAIQGAFSTPERG